VTTGAKFFAVQLWLVGLALPATIQFKESGGGDMTTRLYGKQTVVR
jgi:hypothetical protein